MSRHPLPDDPAGLLELARSGDERALGRALTVIERGGERADALGAMAHAASGAAHVIGVTGAPGAGKSTLVAHLATRASTAGHRPAVLAVDPSSPVTGGAILGDRIRMEDVPPGVFVRSMATRGRGGGLALAVPGAVRVLDACGHDPVVVETVGVGQVELDVAGAADTVVVLVTPGWGDAVQANKAGLLELADVLVVNKADRPGAADARRDLELMLDLSGHLAWRPPILETVARDGTGVDALWEALEAHRAHLAASGELGRRRATRARAEVLARAGALVEARLAAVLDDEGLLAEVGERRLSPAAAADLAVRRAGLAPRAADAPDAAGGPGSSG